MAQYHFRAVTQDGEMKEGILDAADRDSVVGQLQSKGYIPLAVDEQSTGTILRKELRMPFRPAGIGDKQLLEFTQQLASLLQAGIPLDRALEMIHRLVDDPALIKLIEPIQEGVRRGRSLSKVLAEQKATFSQFYVSLIQAAEMAGNLGDGLDELAQYLERSRALRDRLLSALIYPAILVAVSALSLVIILTYVVPQFQQLFEDMGRALPLSTQIVIAVAEVLRDYGIWLLLGLGGLAWYGRYLLRQPEPQLRWHRALLRLPLFGDLVKRTETARFTRSLGTLVKGGVPLLRAMGIARQTLTNRVMIGALEQAAESLKQGRHLAAPLLATAVFPALAMQMIQVGEETGRLEEMLIKVADVYDREVATAIQRMLAVMEPVLIVGLGILIAGIIMSILVAIMSINDIPL